MTTEPKDKFSVRLRQAGLTEVNGEIIAQGFVDIEAIGQLKVADYQREVLKGTGDRAHRLTTLERAVDDGTRLPAIVLGMRGENFRSSGDDLLLNDPVYIVDGLQRTHAMQSSAERHPERAEGMMIGCEVRFGTSHETEKELFQTLNTKRTGMSPNVILRNARDKNKAILTIYGLSTSDSTSPIYDRVQWGQRRTRGQLFTALAVVRTMDMLHRHTNYKTGRGVVGAGAHGGGHAVANMLSVIDRKSQAVGLKTFRENICEFFDVVDQSFGLRAIEYGELSPHLRTNFLIILARLLSDHEDFWDGNQLNVSTTHKKKLASFAIDDPNIIRLCGGSNTTQPILYGLIKEHMNKGLKSRHLTPRQRDASLDAEPVMEAAE